MLDFVLKFQTIFTDGSTTSQINNNAICYVNTRNMISMKDDNNYIVQQFENKIPINILLKHICL